MMRNEVTIPYNIGLRNRVSADGSVYQGRANRKFQLFYAVA
jgi:hypothetical protein